jgi:hypothetical protein
VAAKSGTASEIYAAQHGEEQCLGVLDERYDMTQSKTMWPYLAAKLRAGEEQWFGLPCSLGVLDERYDPK